MEELIWGFKIVLFICVGILAISVKAVKLILAPMLLLIFGGFKVGGVLGLMMIITGAAIGFGTFSFFAAAKTYHSRTY